MTQSNPDRTPEPNPSDIYPPTRPGPYLTTFLIVAILVVIGFESWSDISPHVPQIAKAIGL